MADANVRSEVTRPPPDGIDQIDGSQRTAFIKDLSEWTGPVADGERHPGEMAEWSIWPLSRSLPNDLCVIGSGSQV